MTRPRLDVTTANPARRYNYWLGGKDHFAADRASGDAIAQQFPGIITAARANRAFLQRAVAYLADVGVDQFLDIGPGLPAPGCTHEVAQQRIPAARVVYVDHDPLVMAHARALLTGTAPGATGFIEADLTEPQSILGDTTLTDTLDMSRPVGLILTAVLQFVPDDHHAQHAVTTLLQALAPGSFLALSHATGDLLTPRTSRRLATAGSEVTGRPRPHVQRFFDGLTMIPPGLVAVSRWRPDPGSRPPPDDQVPIWGGVARKTAP